MLLATWTKPLGMLAVFRRLEVDSIMVVVDILFDHWEVWVFYEADKRDLTSISENYVDQVYVTKEERVVSR